MLEMIGKPLQRGEGGPPGAKEGRVLIKRPAKEKLVRRDMRPLKGQCHEIFCFWFFS